MVYNLLQLASFVHLNDIQAKLLHVSVVFWLLLLVSSNPLFHATETESVKILYGNKYGKQNSGLQARNIQYTSQFLRKKMSRKAKIIYKIIALISYTK